MSAIRGSVSISYIGGSAGAKARFPLDGGVRYLECPLKDKVPLYCQGLSFTLLMPYVLAHSIVTHGGGFHQLTPLTPRKVLNMIVQS